MSLITEAHLVISIAPTFPKDAVPIMTTNPFIVSGEMRTTGTTFSEYVAPSTCMFVTIGLVGIHTTNSPSSLFCLDVYGLCVLGLTCP